MATKGTAKMFKHGKAQTMYVSIPAKIASDSTFPFEFGEVVNVELRKDGSILVSKA